MQMRNEHFFAYVAVVMSSLVVQTTRLSGMGDVGVGNIIIFPNIFLLLQ